MTRPAVMILALACALMLSGCGRRGALEAPPEARPAAVQTAPSKYSLDGGKREAETKVTPPNDPFILDPLL